MNARKLTLGEPFDAIFSNAVLHWITEPVRVISEMYRNLKPGGRLVAELGGKGNVATIMAALREALRVEGFTVNAQKEVWFFPSPGQYTSLLEKAGFVITYVLYFARLTPLQESNSGMRDWLEMFARPYLEGLTTGQAGRVLDKTVEALQPSCLQEGQWMADYQRLRVVAWK